MSTGKREDQASRQLQLFGVEEHADGVLKPSAFVDVEPAAHSGLRLVVSTAGAGRSIVGGPPEDLAAIAARLVGRAKFF